LKNLILMALDKAEHLTDEELAEEIAQLESGKRKLRLRDERGRPVPLNDLIAAVFRGVQQKRKK
jgi:hypothetical protein